MKYYSSRSTDGIFVHTLAELFIHLISDVSNLENMHTNINFSEALVRVLLRKLTMNCMFYHEIQCKTITKMK